MNQNRWVLAGFLGGILAAVIYASLGMYHAGRRETPYSVSVIISDSSSDRWTAFREGLEQGAEEYHISVNVVTAGKIESAAEEDAMIRRELDGGADGLIVEPCSYDREGILSHTLLGKYALYAGTESTEKDPVPVVMPDYGAMAEALAESMADAGVKGEIAILSGDQKKPAMQRCLVAFLAAAKERGMTVAWEMDEAELEAEDAAAGKYVSKEGDGEGSVAAMLGKAPVDAIAALDNRALEKAVREVPASGTAAGTRIFGVGRSSEAIAACDEGAAEALVVPDEYYMGYRCIAGIGQQLGVAGSGIPDREISFLRVTQDTLYDEEMEGILFPVVR